MKKKILIVDDHQHIVELLSMRLRARNYEVIEAYDGIQCVQRAKEESPDLILLDIKMPLMSGIEAFEQLIQFDITKEIPVIFMTAYPTVELKNQLLNTGAKGFITKPFISKDLELIIEKVINGHDFNERETLDPTYMSLY